MKSTELRVGNLIDGHYDYDDGEPLWIQCKVLALDSVGLTEHEIWVEGDGFNETYYDFKGIPLTEEWLLKFHNKEEIEKSVIFPNEITIYDRFLFIWKENYKYWYVVTAYRKEYLTKIEFVHEYQNFMFALCGENLTIKP